MWNVNKQEKRLWIANIPTTETAATLLEKKCPPNKNTVIRFQSYRLITRQELLAMTHINMDYNLSQNLITNEIYELNPDIVALQNVDDFIIWRTILTNMGYDSIYKQRTQLKHLDNFGNLIAYKRHLFQLFKSVSVEFNESVNTYSNLTVVQKELLLTDDVGVIAFLQPWGTSSFQSAICVSCAMISDELQEPYCRGLVVQYFTEQIELENQSYGLPILLAISIDEEPTGRSYHILRTGRTPISAHSPRKVPEPPQCTFISRTSCKVSWRRPKVSFGDKTILGYRITWKAGGNKILGFSFEKTIGVGECTQYEYRVENGVRTTTVLDWNMCTIQNLSSDIPYQFKVLAYNEIGDGEWSEVSAPITLSNPSKAPMLPLLKHFLTKEQLASQLQTSTQGQSDDYFISRTVATSLETEALIENKKGRILPLTINPRSGYMLNKELIEKKVYINKLEHEKNRIRLDEGVIDEAYDMTTTRLNQAVILDGKEVLRQIGAESDRQVHYLGLRSAYEEYSIAGEPLFTQSVPSAMNSIGIKCSDYIFYSEAGLTLQRVLSLPRLCSISGDDSRLPPSTYDRTADLPPSIFQPFFNLDQQLNLDYLPLDSAKKLLENKLGKQDTDANEFWGGMWLPKEENNEKRRNVFLPNYSSGSSHLALCVEFRINSTYVGSEWIP